LRDLKPDNIAAILLCPGFTATERAIESGAAAVYGEPDPMDVPEKAATYLASCDNPMDYTGKIVDAATLVQELNLL
jgi:hypothetical protein